MEIDLTDRARQMVRTEMRQLRLMTPPSLKDRNRAATTDIRSGIWDGKPTERLIIHLHSSGCGWAQASGGCTMCGFYAATTTGLHISSEEYQEQVTNVLSMYDPGRFQILGLYNAGNLLNESEMPFDALEKICLLISQNPHIKRLSIESKPEYIDAEKLRRISAILQGKEIEIGMGLETLNAKVRDLCINKPYSRRLLEKKVDLMFSLGIIPKAYLLLKPPFLTEKEAIDDFLSSYQQLHQMGIHRIDCETMTIENHTLVHLLWQKNLYRTPWLWTIIYLLEQLKESKIYFTPFRYIVNSLAIAKNCERCSQLVKNNIFDYQEGKLTLEELVKLDCSCKEDWLADLNKTDERPIEARVIDFLSNIELLNGYSVEPLHTSIPESLEVYPNE